jgi:hypothetical protein
MAAGSPGKCGKSSSPYDPTARLQSLVRPYNPVRTSHTWMCEHIPDLTRAFAGEGVRGHDGDVRFLNRTKSIIRDTNCRTMLVWSFTICSIYTLATPSPPGSRRPYCRIPPHRRNRALGIDPRPQASSPASTRWTSEFDLAYFDQKRVTCGTLPGVRSCWNRRTPCCESVVLGS